MLTNAMLQRIHALAEITLLALELLHSAKQALVLHALTILLNVALFPNIVKPIILVSHALHQLTAVTLQIFALLTFANVVLRRLALETNLDAAVQANVAFATPTYIAQMETFVLTMNASVALALALERKPAGLPIANVSIVHQMGSVYHNY